MTSKTLQNTCQVVSYIGGCTRSGNELSSTATFRSSVEDTAPFETVLEGMRRELAIWNGADSVIQSPNANSIPARKVVGVDVLPLASKLLKNVQELKAARVSRRVGEELAAFCAEHDCAVLEGDR